MAAGSPRSRIGIVSDDPVFLSVIAEFLREEGYNVVTWPDEIAAAEGVVREQPDLVLLDFRPDHPELESTVLVTIRQNPSLADVHVLVCSVDPRYIEATEPELHRHGDDVIAKPFDLNDLEEKIERLLRQT